MRVGDEGNEALTYIVLVAPQLSGELEVAHGWAN